MNKTIKNLIMGIFVLGAIAILISVILFLKPTVGDGKQTLFVRFSDINNINIGTRVRFAGKPVGEVVAVEEIHDARDEPMDEAGRVYFFQLTLHIDSKVKVYNTDEISIQSSGLLGEKSIAIIPKSPPKGVVPRLVNNQPIYANSVDTFQNTLIDLSELASTMEDTFMQANHWIRNHGEGVAFSIQAAGSAMAGISQAVSDYNQTGMIHDVHRGILGLSDAIHQMNEKQTFQNVGIMMENMKSATQELSEGKGTLGKLMSNEDLYLQLNAVMTKVNTLMNDINHYGLVFHLNKQWQRTRQQKISFLNALETPQSFRSYFQNEVDDINTAMSRLSMLISKADVAPQRDEILQSLQFKEDFSNLLRKAEELSDNLRLYNQQLNEAAGK